MDIAPLVGPILNVGAVGACLVMLAFYFIKKDKKYDVRIDERFVREKELQGLLVDLNEKYRLALEKFGQTLDAVVRVMPKKDGG